MDLGAGYDPSLVAVGNDTLFVAYVNENNVYVVSSKDGGVSFGEPVKVNDASVGERWDVQMTEENGSLYLVWIDTRDGGNIYFSKSDDGGASWSANTRVNSAQLETIQNPQIAINSKAIYIIWTADNPEGSLGNAIYFVKSPDGGNEWTNEIRIYISDDFGYNVFQTSLCVDEENIYIVWGNYGTNIMFSKSIDGGINWSAPVHVNDQQVFHGGAGLPYPSIVQSPDSCYLYVTWVETRLYGPSGNVYAETAGILFSKSSDGGNTWDLNTNVSITNSFTLLQKTAPSICTDNYGNIHAVWLEINENSPVKELSGSTLYDIFFSTSTDQGSTWSTPQKVSTSPTKCDWMDRPSISCQENNLYITWESFTNDSSLDNYSVLLATCESIVIPPPSVRAEALSSSEILLEWDAVAIDDFDRYEIHISTEPCFVINQSTLVSKITDKTVTSFTISRLHENTTYYFRLRTYTTNGNYIDSLVVSDKTFTRNPEESAIDENTGEKDTEDNNTNFFSNILEDQKTPIAIISFIIIILVILAILNTNNIKNKKENMIRKNLKSKGNK